MQIVSRYGFHMVVRRLAVFLVIPSCSLALSACGNQVDEAAANRGSGPSSTAASVGGSSTTDPSETTSTTAEATTTTVATTAAKPTTTTTTTAKPTTTATTVKPTTTTTTAKPTTTTTTAKPGTVAIDEGESGPQVKLLQQALKNAGFDPGTIDGDYGGSTLRAVWAFKALSDKDQNSVVSPAELAALQDGWQPTPRKESLGANRTEIDLDRQTLVLYAGNKPVLITHISSGSGEHYCDDAKSKDPDQPPPTLRNGEPKQVCGDADTPKGSFEYGRRESKWYRSELGKLYNPVFFNGGIAVHGATSVPDYPASHGCVRIPMHIAEYFQTLVKTGDPVVVL